MEKLLKEIIEKYKNLPEKSFICSGYTLYDKSTLIDDVDEFAVKVPTLLLGEKPDENSAEYHEYYKKYVVLIAILERLSNDIKHNKDYIPYPKGTENHIGPRD